MKSCFLTLIFILFSLNLFAQIDKERAEKSFYEGTELLLNQEFESAKGKFDDAIFFNRGYIEAYEKRGEVKAIIGNHSEAIADFTKAIDLVLEEGEDSWHSTTNLYYNRGISKSELGDYRGAINDLSIIIEASKFEMDGKLIFTGGYIGSMAFFSRGLMKYKQHNYQGAIDDFSGYIKNGVEWSQPYIYRGLSKIKSDDIEGGCIDLSRAGELGDSDAYSLIRKYCN
jgi:tetratricopeptide (TPR) repeat protein